MAILQSDSISSTNILTCKANENTMRKSKLNLVDLVSSEMALETRVDDHIGFTHLGYPST